MSARREREVKIVRTFLRDGNIIGIDADGGEHVLGTPAAERRAAAHLYEGES